LLQAEGFQVSRGLMGNEPILDFGMPLKISGKRWGSLRVGVSLLPLQQSIRKLMAGIIAFALLFSAFALALFHIAGQRLSTPLEQLAQAMEKVPEHRPDLFAERVRRDEIGQLQTSFIRLLDRLEKSETERDISQKKLLENERLVTIGNLVSGVAHEVNNPLAGIQGALYHIEQKADPEILRYVSLVQSEVDRIGRIVHQLLDLSRAGELETDWIESQYFLQSLCSFARMGLKDKQVHFGCNVSAAPQVMLKIDHNKLHQLLINLLLNAADATGPGGEIQLSVEVENKFFVMRVDDDGAGVPPELKDKIFDLFYTTKEPGSGTGIGLSFCRSIAEKHNGELVLEEKNTPGARFVLRLPLLRYKG
jgi:signal transduction histidine kinase